ncbi:MAG: hypothetical protein Alpg2KO_29870 [Alphaproteobacteria bacterium]
MSKVIEAALRRAAEEGMSNGAPKADRVRYERVLFGDTDTTVRAGDAEVPAMILEGRKRVTTIDGAAAMVGMSRRELAGLMRSKWGKAMPQDIRNAFRQPINAMQPDGKRLKVVEMSKVLRLADVIYGIAMRNDPTPRGRFEQMTDGYQPQALKAAVDEATGFNQWLTKTADDPESRHYLGDKLREDGKRFPTEFYVELYRLLGWDRDPYNNKRPPVVGKITKKLIYSPLPEAVLGELERRNPTREGRHYRGGHHHRYLSTDLGNRALTRQIDQVVVLMRISSSWDEFKYRFSQAFESRPASMTRIEPDLRLDRRRPASQGMGMA